MIDNAYLEADEGTWVLILEDAFGTHQFPCDPELLDSALGPWRQHIAEGEAVRRERIAAGGISWREYMESQARNDPDWAEALRESADLLRKSERESAA